VGNPHAVAFVGDRIDDLIELGSLAEPPVVEPAEVFPEGVNVELVAEVGERHLAMRVHERGVGETQSCGTGACAVLAVALARDGALDGPTPQPWILDVPGGRLTLRRGADGGVELTGPAVLVARGTLDAAWLTAVHDWPVPAPTAGAPA
jgi:diaminopimelate epimerase